MLLRPLPDVRDDVGPRGSGGARPHQSGRAPGGALGMAARRPTETGKGTRAGHCAQRHAKWNVDAEVGGEAVACVLPGRRVQRRRRNETCQRVDGRPGRALKTVGCGLTRTDEDILELQAPSVADRRGPTCCKHLATGDGRSEHRRPETFVFPRENASDPDATRTRGLRFRKPPLYPAELRGLVRRRRAPGRGGEGSAGGGVRGGGALPGRGGRRRRGVGGSAAGAPEPAPRRRVQRVR